MDKSKAIHSIRNSLSPLMCYAELVRMGDTEAQHLLLEELELRIPQIARLLDDLENEPGMNRRAA